MTVKHNDVIRHFLDLSEIGAKDLRTILDFAQKIKTGKSGRVHYKFLVGKSVAMIFEKLSTRTRISFEVGITELGGSPIVLNMQDIQLGNGETISDTARVISRFVDMVMIRCFSHKTVSEMAQYADIPIINGLTDYTHPCQVMADLMTIEERRGNIATQKIAWVGDATNVLNSLIHAAHKFGFKLKIATPEDLAPRAEIMQWAAENAVKISWSADPKKAVAGADVVMTDTWFSMGRASNSTLENHLKAKLLFPYQVNDKLMAGAKKSAIFMHCLPAHREQEVTSKIIDGETSVVFDQAENRLHIQKAIMSWLTHNI